MITVRHIPYVFLCLLIALFFMRPALALTVHDVTLVGGQKNTDIQISLSEGSDFRAFILENPYRIIVDLPRFQWDAKNIQKPQNFVISDIRQGILQDGFSRIVFDLKKPMRIRSAEISKNNQIILTLQDVAPDTFAKHKNDLFGSLTVDDSVTPEMQKVISGLKGKDGFLEPASLVTAPTAATVPTPKSKPARDPQVEQNTISEEEKPMIVIDAGHGGIDPGAIGADERREKDVVLALAQDLRDSLLKSGRYRVEMTRSKDTFISLKDRVHFARVKKADLFISIHADSIHRTDVRGSSVYTLSKEASDAQTAKLAEKENSADLIAGVDLSVEDEQIAFILGDFLMTETLNQSKFFANTLVASMKDANVSVLDNTHRYAGFAVLKAPDIPSVLVEAGFMSNKKESRLLAQKEHRKKIIGALKDGIDAYFNHIE
jgi:N-acetylmuramoyl-L-alanine amidase